MATGSFCSPMTTSIPSRSTISRQAARRSDTSRLEELTALRAERFELMAQLAELPDDFVFYTQITMEAAEDPEFLDAMRKAHIRGALVGVESVTAEGLKAVFKNFNDAGEALVGRLQAFRQHDIHILGSFIFGLPTDKAETFPATADLAQRAGVSFAQFVMLTPFPGTLDFAKWEKEVGREFYRLAAYRSHATGSCRPTRGPKVTLPHPTMSADEIRRGTQRTWDQFYSTGLIWQRSRFLRKLRSRLVFMLISTCPARLHEHRHRNRQRANEPLSTMGTMAGQGIPSLLRDRSFTGSSQRRQWPRSRAGDAAGRR